MVKRRKSVVMAVLITVAIAPILYSWMVSRPQRLALWQRCPTVRLGTRSLQFCSLERN